MVVEKEDGGSLLCKQPLMDWLAGCLFLKNRP